MTKIKRDAFDVVQFEALEAVVKELEDLKWFALVFKQNGTQSRRQR